MSYLNYDALAGITADSFRNRQPYPWVNIQNILTGQGYEELRQTMPEVEAFQKMVGVKRAHGQGYHDRYLLHYNSTLALGQPWRTFVAELNGKGYENFLRRMLDIPSKPLILTMEWYYAWQGCSVSPHCDARRKRATHIFYFNTEEDWQSDWGGHILILDDERRYKPHSGPSFDDLKVAASIDPRGNGSLLFERTEHSWHGVRPLQPPAQQLRKLFIITINVPTLQVWWRRVRGKDPDGYRIPVMS